MKKPALIDNAQVQVGVLAELLRMTFESDLGQTQAMKRDVAIIRNLPARYAQHVEADRRNIARIRARKGNSR